MIYHKTYPTGRKHCSRCGRWRLITDFSVRLWLDPITREIPRTLQALCHVCNARQRRGEGVPPRQFGYNRKRADKTEWARIKSDPIRLAREREYHRIWSEAKRREAGKPQRNTGPVVRLVATEYGAQLLYYKRGKDGQRVVNSRRKIVDPALVGVGSQDSSSSS